MKANLRTTLLILVCVLDSCVLTKGYNPQSKRRDSKWAVPAKEETPRGVAEVDVEIVNENKAQQKAIEIILDSVSFRLPFKKTDGVWATVVNNTDSIVEYGMLTLIEKFDNGKWTSADARPNAHLSMRAISFGIGPKSEKRLRIAFLPDVYYYKSGKYRIKKKFDNLLTRKSYVAYAEFEVVE